MRLKLGVALLVFAALGAVLASSAFAAAVTEDVKWFTGAGPGAELAGAEAISAAAVGRATFQTEVGGESYKLEWNRVECVECKIENAGGAAVGSGKLKFVGVVVVEPAGCLIAPEVTTKALSIEADWMAGKNEGPNYWKFAPTATGAAFAIFEVALCLPAPILRPKGTLFFRTANWTGVQAVEQEATTSGAINTEAGGSLEVGAEPAVLTASVKFEMSGAKAGVAFGTH